METTVVEFRQLNHNFSRRYNAILQRLSIFIIIWDMNAFLSDVKGSIYWKLHHINNIRFDQFLIRNKLFFLFFYLNKYFVNSVWV